MSFGPGGLGFETNDPRAQMISPTAKVSDRVSSRDVLQARSCDPGVTQTTEHGAARNEVLVFVKVFGAGEWTRTIDLLITNQLLYQLSYAGQACHAEALTGRESEGGWELRSVTCDGKPYPAA